MKWLQIRTKLVFSSEIWGYTLNVFNFANIKFSDFRDFLAKSRNEKN